MNARDFANLDREARLNILREVAHHSGIESLEYLQLARAHEYALNKANNVTLRRPIK
jgi:hypothetical protein